MVHVFFSSAGDVLEMSMVKGVGGVCDMCMYLARNGVGGVGGKWVRGLGLGFTNPGGTWGSGICFYVFVAVVWVVLGAGGVGGRTRPGSGTVGWYYACVCCESGFCVVMAGPGICILCNAQPAHLRYTQCSIMLHIIDICFLPYIYL